MRYLTTFIMENILMKIVQLIYVLLLVCVLGCVDTQIDFSETDKEIKKLETDDDKRKFLETLFELDQEVRGEQGSEIMLQYGMDSNEYRDYIQSQINQDAINLIKVERYIAHYGHPKKSKLGEIAALTPWAVIHHAQGYAARENNFEILYQAYLEGDIDDGKFSMFLGRMYYIRNGKRFEMESPYRSDDEINQLIRELNMQQVKKKVQSKHS